jgi:hypothetical protein
MHEFELVAVTGDVSAVSVVRTPLGEMEITNNDITIQREFFAAGTDIPATAFLQGDLVRVQITVDYATQDLRGSYVITDFLPAGLVHVPNSARFDRRDPWNTQHRHAFVRTEGQRVTFFDYNGVFNRGHVYFYYARVVNPGTFTAEGTLVQSLNAREYMAVGENATITITGE